MPETTKVVVCKNSLLKVAVGDKPTWAPLAEKGCRVGLCPHEPPWRTARPAASLMPRPHRMQGENAWVFVPESDMQDVIKAYFKFEEEVYADAVKNAPKPAEGQKAEVVKKPAVVTAAAMDSQYLSSADVRRTCFCQPVLTNLVDC